MARVPCKSASKGKPASRPSPPPSPVTPDDMAIVGKAADANAPELAATAVPATLPSSMGVLHAYIYPPRETVAASGREGRYPMEGILSDDDSECKILSNCKDWKRCDDRHDEVLSEGSDSTVSSCTLYRYSLPKPLPSCPSPSRVEMEVGEARETRMSELGQLIRMFELQINKLDARKA
jgi:hypothetical protein